MASQTHIILKKKTRVTLLLDAKTHLPIQNVLQNAILNLLPMQISHAQMTFDLRFIPRLL